MLEKTRTYHKSALGAQAIATRSAALTPKLRSLLIMIDGKRGYEELAKLGGMLGDVDLLLTQLADQGLIEPVEGYTAPPAAPAPAAPAPVAGGAPAHPAVPLATAQRHAARRLTDLLGPNAEELCMRIESTRNAQEFMAAIHRAEGMLRQYGGEKMVAEFAADMARHRPA